MRITGLATGLDVDSIVKQTMSAYRTKIDQQAQKKDIAEIRQKLYTDVMKDSKEFYNKHFDILKSDSLFSSTNWKNVEFTSSSTSVKVSGNSEAKSENYKISGNTATATSLTLTGNDIEAKSEIIINGKGFILDGNSSKNISDFNAKLKSAGINVSARYTSFTGNDEAGLILESTKLGKGNEFKVSTSNGSINNSTNTTIGVNSKKDLAAFEIGVIVNNIDSVQDENDVKDKFKVTITKGGNSTDIEMAFNDIDTTEDKVTKINNALKANSNLSDVFAEIDNGNIVFRTSKVGQDEDAITINIEGESQDSGYILKTQPAKNTEVDLGINLNNLSGKISINGIYIDLTSVDESNKLSEINNKLKSGNSDVELVSNGIDYKLVSKVEGESGTINAYKLNKDYVQSNEAEDANIRIEDSKGGVYTHKGSLNTFTVDGITFDFKGKIETVNEPIKITGETNTDTIKDGIVKLFNDYNTLMEKLNTLTTEKKNKGYAPLTKEQRSELSEKEVELWDEKVKQGQLYKDSDLTRITNSLKSAMRTMVSGTGLTLEKIGIAPVADYGGPLNGTFIIDETKLSKALETNLDDIKNMFVSSKPTIGTESEKYSGTGIMYRLKDIIYSETMTSTSALSKKAGLLGTATATDNTLSKSIKAYERKMEDMEIIFLRKEQLLYAQYAKLETAMNNYNTQQSSLAQAFGLGS